MKNSRERILLVENDPDISDLVARQTLQPLGYRIQAVWDPAAAIQEVNRHSPDMVIANLNLPGLSGKDLLVALASQGIEVPVIVIARKGMEADVIQTFRLGASDYLIWPFREAEVLSAVERVLKQVRDRQASELLAQQLKRENEDLHRRVRELTTIFTIGKAITSTLNQQELLEKIVEGAVYVTEADCGWFLIRVDQGQPFTLSAERNLPKNFATRLHQPWEDGISSLAALSGESLTIHGEPLARLKVFQLGESALVVPVKLKKAVIGLLGVARKESRPFSTSSKTLAEAIAGYASISLVNARLFRALEERASSLQIAAENALSNERMKDEILNRLNDEISRPLANAMGMIDSLLIGETACLDSTQKGILSSTREKMQSVLAIVDSINPRRLKR